MNTEDNNQEAVVTPEVNEVEEANETPAAESDTISLSREEYDKMNETLGSLKRENKRLKKPNKGEQVTTNQTKNMDEVNQKLLERTERLALKAANIIHEDDMDLARKTAEKWGMDIEDLIEDDDFNAKLERQRTARANLDATSGVKGDGAGTSPKMTAEYWQSKGVPPTAADVPDRKTRASIIRQMMGSARDDGKKFYND